ncbi:uncharacterized protein LOC130426864 isoform X2 [Triplophysa dalaica]|uniref:uncharacterized protein LOC130426864 isoform X2 n=1 Tax=Triplophysa dalaica TaxID=1582913 RepID=UPI0024DFFC2E|nr:uncharacterized protein LOC130426864 isoform X2 [Triplophysa dalaica]
MIDLCNCVRFKMHLSTVHFLSALLMIADGFTVKGPSGPLVVPLGGSVLLPCSVDSLLSLKDLEVEWKRSDSQTLIHLYQDGDIRPEVQHEDYHDRAHFFTDDIKQGNFSLLLKNVTAEDEGKYTCTVHSGQESHETVLQIKDVEFLMVTGSDDLISMYVGKNVTLNCSVDSHIPPEDIEEVSWKKRVENEYIMVLLYQNKVTVSEASDAQYTDRVEFFSDEIHRGNFSLRLKRVRTEDKGLYMCQVFAGRLSDNATVTLQQLGFSALHIMVLILCIAACGCAVIICCLIYCTSQNKEKPVKTLGYFYVFLPNIMMFVAFLLWGVTEGFLYETIFCCALCLLRPLTLINVAPYSEKVLSITVLGELLIFTVVYFSVLFRHTWETVVHFATFDKAVVIVVFGLVLLLCAIAVVLWKFVDKWFAAFILFSLPSLQFILLFFTFGSASRAGFFVIVLFPMFFFLTISCLVDIKGGQKSCVNLLNITSWLIFMFIMMAVMAYFYVTSMGNEKDVAGWTCTAVFLQVLWMITMYMGFTEPDVPYRTFLYVFGSVGVVLIMAVALMTELILKTVNGDRAVGDLRTVVYPSEGLFTLTVLIFIMFEPWIAGFLQCLQKIQKPADTSANTEQQNQEHQTKNTSSLYNGGRECLLSFVQ